MAAAEKYTLTATERAVAMIMCTPLPKIFVRHMKCPKQTNGNDCGVYDIANMISILHGIDPRSVRFNVSVRRRHPQQELEIRKSLISNIENVFFFQLIDVIKMVKTTFRKTTSLCYKRDPRLLTLRQCADRSPCFAKRK